MPPDIHSFHDDLERILVTMHGAEWLNAVEISTRLADQGIGVHWKRITSLLDSNRELAQRRKSGGRWYYKILKKGVDRIQKQSPVLLIEPTKAVQAVSTIQELLKKLTGTVKICDPYVDETIFQFLDSCAPSITIRILSKNPKNIPQLKLLLNAHKTQGRNIELKNASVNVLHDRYIIDSNSMIILGTSFNGLGKKQSFVIRVGPDIRLISETYFDELWEKAAQI